MTTQENLGEGEQPPAEPPNDPPQSDPNGEQDGGTEDEKLGEGGKKALDRERADRKVAEKRASEAEAALKQYQDAEKTELQRAQESASTVAADLEQTQKELWLYRALADHPIPEEHRHLVNGETEEEVREAAESISKLVHRPGVVKESGTGGGSSSAGTSVNTGRDLYRSRHNRNRKD